MKIQICIDEADVDMLRCILLDVATRAITHRNRIRNPERRAIRDGQMDRIYRVATRVREALPYRSTPAAGGTPGGEL